MSLVSPGVTVQVVDESYYVPLPPKFQTKGFKKQVFITNWQWWDEHASEIHTWLNECTEGGVKYGTDSEPGQAIKFKHEEELTAFILRWS